MSKFLYVLRHDRGATAIEYGLIVGAVALAIFGAVTQVGGATMGLWDRVAVATEEASS